MLGRRRRQRGRLLFQWTAYAVAGLLLIGMPRQLKDGVPVARHSPEADYREIERAFYSGDLSAAQEQVEAGRARWSQTGEYWTDRFRVEAARIALYQGHNETVLELLREPVSIRSDVVLRVRRESFRSLALARTGKVEEAQQALARAQEQSARPGLEAEIAAAAGGLALELGQDSRAEGLFRHALDLAQRTDDTFLSMQLTGNLGVVELKKERFEDAASLFAQAGELARRLGSRLALEKYLGNVGYSFYGAGDFIRALAGFREATAEAVKLGASIDEVEWRDNAGLCEFELGQLKAARKDFEGALSKAEAVANQEQIADSHESLGLLLAAEDPQLARRHAEIALMIARSRKDQPEEFAAEMLYGSLLLQDGDAQEKEEGGRELLALTREAALAPSLRWRVENALGQAAAAKRDGGAAEIWFRRALTTLRQQRNSLKTVEYQLPFRENGSDLLNNYLEHLIGAGKPWEALTVLDEGRGSTLLGDWAGTKEVQAAVDPERLAKRLKATVLVYRVRSQQSYLWAIGEHGRAFYRLQDGNTLHALMQRHQAAILASRDLMGPAGEAGHALYNALVEPAKNVVGSSRRVYVIMDGDLTGLNFETLLTNGPDAHFWIDYVAVTNARSIRQVERVNGEGVRTERAGRPRLLLMGNSTVPGSLYPELKYAAEEVDRVAAHFTAENRTVLWGEQSTPAAYGTSKPGQFTFIHFVAHGEANDIQPVNSSILLAGAPEFRLYARDVMSQPLKAELVTLSSCYGSGTRSYSGEGLVGLAWAFQRAGARHVIGSLWQVSDQSTPALMDRLYTELDRGVPVDLALRTAKMALLHQESVVRKPFYWAPFVLY